MIRRIFTTEIIKIKSYKPFWFFLIAHSGLYLLVALIMSNVSASFTVNNTPLQLSRLFAYPYAWHTLSWVGKWFYFILGFPVILLVINEFDHRTLRQQIVNGISRREFTLNRLILIAGFSTLACSLVLISAVLFGKSMENSAVFSLDAVSFLFGFFIQGIGFLGFALFVSIFLKKAIPAAGVFLIWPLIAEPVLGLILDHQLNWKVSQWLPCEVFSSVIPSPFGIISSGGPVAPPEALSVLTSLAYSGFMFILILVKVKTSDL